jgi:enamine deaminase RidA (YjgF/YER057c/UK114 family)
MKLAHVNPSTTYESLRSRGYTQVVVAENPRSLIVVSGQLPLDADNRVVGAGDIEAQTRAVYDNLRRSLQAVGADLASILRMNTYITDLANHPPLIRRVRAEYFGKTTPPASTMIEVSRLPPGVLIEVDALAGL